MLNKLFRTEYEQGAPFPTNKQEAVAYTEEIAEGLKSWTRIDLIIIPLVTLVWALGGVPTVIFGGTVAVALGCPLIMILGYSIGCLQYLRPRECYEVVRAKLTN